MNHLCIRSPDPRRLAGFFERAFGMRSSTVPGGWRCEAPGRVVFVTEGKPNSVAYYAFGFPNEEALGAYKNLLLQRGVNVEVSPSPVFDAAAFAVRDLDGNVGVFGVGSATAPLEGDNMSARLQHIVFRTQNLDAMARFYEQNLGFVVSDRVLDKDGVLHACFLRTDSEHHSLAMFLSPTMRLDHHSYETTDWEAIRCWADRMSASRIPIVWGVGRHGPGNDLFFMVKDPDDNLVEISAELAECAEDRPAGLWPHEQRTLNVWGNAIMRS